MNKLRLVTENIHRETADSYTPIVTIYADASCLRNGSPDAAAGCGAVLIDRKRMEVKLAARYLGTMTNQQAEILAYATALEELRRPCRIEIFSDSMYVIDTMTGLNRMKTNRPFWDRLVQTSLRHHISWRWVKGHSGVVFQEAADRLARAASSAQTDLMSDDLDYLAEHLSDDSNQLSVRSFETELDKIVSRYDAFCDKSRVIPNLDGMTAFPSAFSA